jgi:pilus assembly protein Flp/PilA
MLKLYVYLHNFLTQPVRRDDRGVTSVEYGLMLALVAVAITLAVGPMSGALRAVFGSVTTSLAPGGG